GWLPAASARGAGRVRPGRRRAGQGRGCGAVVGAHAPAGPQGRARHGRRDRGCGHDIAGRGTSPPCRDPAGVTASPAGVLRQVLETAREFGFLGPGDPEAHIRHAEAFAAAVESRFGTHGPKSFLDLGSGAGVPGLILAARWPESRAALVDASERRCAFARESVTSLGFEERVSVRCERARVLGRDPAMREECPRVRARPWAARAVTAEGAAPFLEVGGFLIVSEPPATDLADRWPTAALDEFGFGEARYERFVEAGVAVIEKVAATPDAYPR